MSTSNVTGIILAAGQSTRMGETNKLIKHWQGKPLVCHAAEAALASRLDKVIVVTGHEAEAIEEVLPKGCLTAWNGDYAGGMAGSIRCGQYRMQGYGPVMILLGDMPLVTAHHIDRMLDAFAGANDDAIIVATHNGQWGNPVLFGTPHFRALKLLEGDRGARAVVEEQKACVIEVEIGDAARRDFDVPEAFVD